MALEFDADNANYVSFGTTNLSDPCIAAWIYPNVNNVVQTIGGSWGGAGKQFTFRMLSTGELYLAYFFGVGADLSGVTVVPTGEWSHVVGYYSGDVGAALYLNGVLDNSNADTGHALTAGDTWMVGRDGDGNPFDGRIAEVTRLHDYLFSDQVESLANGASPNRVLAQTFAANAEDVYLPLWGTVAGVEVDFWGSEVPAVNGTLAYADHAPVGSPTAAV